MEDLTPKSRQYRHRSRPVPCDRCRRQKLRCRYDGPPPCHRCRHNPEGCTFSTTEPSFSQPASLHASPSLQTSPVLPPQTQVQVQQLTTPVSHTTTPIPVVDLPPASAAAGSEEPWPFSAEQLLSTQYLSTQISQSLDNIQGHHYQLCGASSDQDPWLLRHYRFDEFGFRRFFKVHIRNAGGVPTREKIPAHFVVCEDEVAEAAKEETRTVHESSLREELMMLVSASHGVRLIRL